MPDGTEPADPAALPDPQRKYRIAVTALVILFAPVAWVLGALYYLGRVLVVVGVLVTLFAILVFALHLLFPY